MKAVHLTVYGMNIIVERNAVKVSRGKSIKWRSGNRAWVTDNAIVKFTQRGPKVETVSHTAEKPS